MGKEAAILVAVIVIITLVAIFLITFIVYIKTPPPKGLEKLKPDEDDCRKCPAAHCLNKPAGEEGGKEKKNA